MFQFFQLTASEKRTYAAGYGSGYIGSCTFEFVCTYLSFYLFEFLFSGGLPVAPCVAWFLLYVAVRLFCFSMMKSFRSRCSLPVTALSAHVPLAEYREVRVCMVAISSSLSFRLFPVSWFIQSNTIWLIVFWTICFLFEALCLPLPADRSANALRLYAGKSVAEWCPSVFGTLHRICVHQPVWCPVW